MAYLLARQYFRYRDFSQTVALAENFKQLGLSQQSKALWQEARLMHGKALFHLGRFEQAKRQFVDIADDKTLYAGPQEMARDWVHRCIFFGQHQVF